MKMSFMEMSTLLLRKKIQEIQLQRSIANEKHEQETLKYKKRLSEMTKKLHRAIHYYRVYFYFQLLQLSSDNVSPFVIQRQAILCAMLHKEEILSRQTRVLQLYQEKLVMELDSFRTRINDEFSATSKSLSVLILKLTSEINILESRKRSIVNISKLNEAPSVLHDGESGYFSEMFKKVELYQAKRSDSDATEHIKLYLILFQFEKSFVSRERKSWSHCECCMIDHHYLFFNTA